MRHFGKSIITILACCILLFVPFAAGFHCHPGIVPGYSDETVAQASGTGLPVTGYSPCEICLRLILQDQLLPITGSLPLARSLDIGFESNTFPRSLHLFSPIGDRAPPLTIG